jgi:DNA-binding transcriptional regulator YdaS (Cro superfamily)
MTYPAHIERIVAAFGGQNAMARALGLRQSTVWAWLQSGHVPSRRIPVVIQAAANLSPPVHLTPADFFGGAPPAPNAQPVRAA